VFSYRPSNKNWESEIGIERSQPATVLTFLFTDQTEKTLKDFGFLMLNLIPQCYVLLILASAQLLCLHHGLRMAASPLDNAIDVAFYFHKRNVPLCFRSAALM